MAIDAINHGQLAEAGNGMNGNASSATSAPPPAINPVSPSLSLPDLTMAFQLACSNAPSRTSSMTWVGIGLSDRARAAEATAMHGSHYFVGRGGTIP